MRTIYLVLLACLAVGIQPAAAKGKQVRYIGIHPVPKAEGGGICHIEAPHVHIFAANKLEYRDHDKHHYFVGDPVAYGYDGPRHAYKGHHPIHVHAVVGSDHEDVEFCYLDGPHFHYFTPPPAIEADFKVAGDAYFYVAEPPPVYIEARPAMIKVNAVYTPLAYTRPVIEVEPPSGWIGVRFSAPAVVVVDDRPPPVVVAPRVRTGVEVRVPMPSISVGVDVGFGVGVGVRGGHRHKHKKHKKHRRGDDD